MNHMTLQRTVAGVPTATLQAMCGPGRGSYRLRNTLPPLRCRRCVVPGRLELPTSTLSVWRSDQLSYRTVQPFKGSSALHDRIRAISQKKNSGVQRAGNKRAP